VDTRDGEDGESDLAILLITISLPVFHIRIEKVDFTDFTSRVSPSGFRCASAREA
jgi:hypothetical protein